ncbi:type II toxin-antitoxin system RelE/ParE family toxin [Hyphomonadaceae bacterium ML37]|nr:type II toxin-antitoxin system RelE/ParE family toxin [Hyphomonadaceae bacterium ML37]
MTRSPDTVRFSVRALADLDAIHAYTLDKWGPEQARTYMLDLITFARQQLTATTLGGSYGEEVKAYSQRGAHRMC